MCPVLTLPTIAARRDARRMVALPLGPRLFALTVAVANPDEAALGHARPDVKARLLGRVEFRDLRSHDLPAVELADTQERPCDRGPGSRGA